MTTHNAPLTGHSAAFSGMAVQFDPHHSAQPRLRRYDVTWLRRTGEVVFGHHNAPAHPAFEACFGGFAHGALVQTPQGPVAIEDLLPGDMVDTRDDGPQPILWRGSIAMNRSDGEPAPRLWRIMTDAFGFERPMCDLLAGPGAWMLHRRPWLHDRGAARPVLTQVSELEDGNSVLAVTPPGTIQLYHLCLPRHAVLRINGLEMDSCHPGGNLRGSLPPRLIGQLLSLFPHIDQPGDFGPLVHPRLSGDGLLNDGIASDAPAYPVMA